MSEAPFFLIAGSVAAFSISAALAEHISQFDHSVEGSKDANARPIVIFFSSIAKKATKYALYAVAGIALIVATKSLLAIPETYSHVIVHKAGENPMQWRR